MMTLKEYFDHLTPSQRTVMDEIKARIRKLLPNAEETMGYGVPSFKLNGKAVVYYAAFREHVSIYPASDEIAKKIPELSVYRGGKGTFKFLLNKPIPYRLIEEFVRVKTKL